MHKDEHWWHPLTCNYQLCSEGNTDGWMIKADGPNVRRKDDRPLKKEETNVHDEDGSILSSKASVVNNMVTNWWLIGEVTIGHLPKACNFSEVRWPWSSCVQLGAPLPTLVRWPWTNCDQLQAPLPTLVRRGDHGDPIVTNFEHLRQLWWGIFCLMMISWPGNCTGFPKSAWKHKIY